MTDGAGDDGVDTSPAGVATVAAETGGTIGAVGTAAGRAWSTGGVTGRTD
ncbi:hypothetical protein [Micromonospora sp. NPDC049891]